MTNSSRYKEALEQSHSRIEYWREVATNEFAVELGERMSRCGINRAELARRLGTSQAYITKVLGGNVNFTIETMVKLALALEGALHLHISDKEALTTRWRVEPTTSGATVFQSGVKTTDVAAHLEANAAEVASAWS